MLLLVMPAHAQEAITLISSEAQLEFPERITFTLTAESSAADITEVTLLYGETRLEALTIVEVETTPARRIETSYELDTQVYYFAPGTDLSYRWLIRDAAGNELTTPLQELVYHDERFNWQSRSERNVTVYWYEGGDVFGDELMATSLRTLDRLQQEIGATVTEPVKIYIYANNSDMRSAMEVNEVEWVGGQARPALGLILAAIAPGDSKEVQRIIPHELSHQIMHQATDNPYGGTPVWFDEGLAVYNQEVLDAGFEEMVLEAARDGRLIPLGALSASFPADPNQALLSYAQSRSVVGYLFDTYGEEKMQALVAAFAEATPVEEAVQEVLGLSVDDLDMAWREALPVDVAAAALPVEEGPLSAPPDRFENPVLPVGAAVPAVPTPAPEPTPGALARLVENTPSWAWIVTGAGLCMVLVALTGAGLLVVLRLVGVDKR